jgi:hypothetical protein
VYEDADPKLGFMLVIDPKWKTHPNPEMVRLHSYIQPHIT